MDLKKFRYFHAAATAGSFKLAARAMNISAPAMTKAIQSLEFQLQVSLFERGQGPARLTSAGKTLLARTRRLLDEADGIRQDMRAEHNGESGAVVIGSGPIASQALVGPALGRLNRDHPGLKLQVISDSTESLVTRLRNFELDMVVADAGGVSPQAQDLKVTPISRTPMYWVAATDHPLARAPQPVQPSELIPFSLAIPTANPEHRRLARAALGAEGGSWVDTPYLRSDSYATLVAAVRQSRCLTILPPLLVHRHVERGELVLLQVAGWDVSGQVALIELADRAPSNARDAVIRALLEPVASDPVPADAA